MKKLMPVVLLVAAAGFLFMMRPSSESDPSTVSSEKKGGSESSSSMASLKTDATAGKLTESKDKPDIINADDDFVEDDIRPATELYTSADEALKAVNGGAKEYDDLILEQFVEPDPACTWCPEFYARINERMLDPKLTFDERSYYAEVLAISGRVDNIASLMNVIQSTADEDEKDVYAEALELTVGDDTVVKYLGDQLGTEDELLKESTIAAITNHGSRLAIDLLYQQTVQSGDADGFYSLGIGLGEVIPDRDSLPYLKDLATKRDKFSHLAVKSLLNQGDDGLKTVITLLEENSNPSFDKQMLEDAVDHVAFEDDTEKYLENIVNTSDNEVVKEFAREILDDFEVYDDYEDDSEELSVDFE